MFGLSMSELILIAIIGIVLFGTKDLPKNLRKVAKGVNDFKKVAGDAQRSWQEVRNDVAKTIMAADVTDDLNAASKRKTPQNTLEEPLGEDGARALGGSSTDAAAHVLHAEGADGVESNAAGEGSDGDHGPGADVAEAEREAAAAALAAAVRPADLSFDFSHDELSAEHPQIEHPQEPSMNAESVVLRPAVGAISRNPGALQSDIGNDNNEERKT